MEPTSSTQMQYARLGKTGLRVSRICLGFMSYGYPEWNGWAKNEDESLALIKKAYDAGINFFDTANTYSNGYAEEILGKAIRQFGMPRDRVVIATKVFFPVLRGREPINLNVQDLMRNPELVNQFGLSRKHIFDAVEASLRRLGTDYIDLYQIHRLDTATPMEETMEALHDLVRMGKVRYIGASSMLAWEFQKMNNIAEKNGWTKFVSMQNLYNLLYREEEREMIPYCLDQGIGGIPWSPLAGGQLSAKNRNSTRGKNDMFKTHFRGMGERERDDRIVDRLVEVAQRKGASPSQVAFAWLLTKPFITAPIFGIGREEHLYDLIGAFDLVLSDQDIASLEELYVPKRNFLG
ncbi:NADP-dependent oxidoreductase domain-containing protein [Dichotomocladium elegans]|nr:NADP-dependent oxidoreductase domain-containing protein [Dichotomocladium elegans]